MAEVDFAGEDYDDNIESIAYKISSWGADLSFRELITMYQEEELAKPEIQRRYVWTKKEASRFIESILLGLPVPSIFLAEYASQKLIVDGYQRIMSIYDYIQKQKFSNEEQIFKLTNSEIIAEKWRGKAFLELDIDDQRKLKSTTIHAIIFSQKEPKQNYSSLYQIFERINTGGQKLTTQEIRNCIYLCSFNRRIVNLNENEVWRELLNEPHPYPRMTDIDLILRFFALSQENVLTLKKSEISLKKIENEYMEKAIGFNDIEIEQNISCFINCIEFIKNKFDLSAFFNYSKETNQFTKRIHVAIFDSLMVATKYILDHDLTEKIPSDIDKRWMKLRKTDMKYREYIATRTTRCEHIRGRINMILKEVYDSEFEYEKL